MNPSLGAISLLTADSRPDSSWGCTEWMRWHEELEKVYGRQVANDFWLKKWKEQSKWSNNYNWCKYNGEFDQYFKSVDIDVGHLISDIVNAGADVADNFLSFSKFMTHPVVLIGLAGIVLYNLRPKIEKGGDVKI
jgi:hypothetical protein